MSAPAQHRESDAPSTRPATHKPVLHHVNLKTCQLQDMIDWYELVAGMRAVHQFPGGAWLTNDGANHRLALLASPALTDDADKLVHTGLHHTAFEYASHGELIDTYERLAALGITPHACLDHGMTMSFYYVDPDGNSVELQADNFGDWTQSTAFVSEAAEFAANPIGVSLDPARVAEARAKGASGEELHARAYAGEFTPEQPLDLRFPLG